jgi:hypothetical protein
MALRIADNDIGLCFTLESSLDNAGFGQGGGGGDIVSLDSSGEAGGTSDWPHELPS